MQKVRLSLLFERRFLRYAPKLPLLLGLLEYGGWARCKAGGSGEWWRSWEMRRPHVANTLCDGRMPCKVDLLPPSHCSSQLPSRKGWRGRQEREVRCLPSFAHFLRVCFVESWPRAESERTIPWALCHRVNTQVLSKWPMFTEPQCLAWNCRWMTEDDYFCKTLRQAQF